MGITAMLERGLGVRNRDVGESQIIPSMVSGQGQYATRPSYTSDLLQAYRVHSWTHAGIKAIGRAVAKVPMIAVEFKKPPKFRAVAEFKASARIDNWAEAFEAWIKYEGATVLESGHEMLELINNPLPEAQLTRYDLLFSTSVYIDLDGNAYWEKKFANEGKTKVVGLWPKIDPRHMWVIPDPKTLIGGYYFVSGATATTFTRDEIIHFEDFNPENAFYGLSAVKVLRALLIADARAVDWNRTFFDNQAEVSGYLKIDRKIGIPDARRIRALWEEQHGGVSRSHRIGVLGDGAEYKKIGLSHTEMGFKELRLMTREEVLGVLGVPSIVAGISREQGLNKAVAKIQEELFYENTVLPRSTLIETKVNFGLMEPGDKVRLVFDISSIEALQEDVDLKARTGRHLTAQGWTLQEMRTRYWNLPPAEGEMVNDVLVPLNVQSAGTVRPEKSVRSVRGRALAETSKQEDPLIGDPAAFLPEAGPSMEDQASIHREYWPMLLLLGAGRGVGSVQDIGVEVPPDWTVRFNFQETIDRYISETMGTRITQINDETQSLITRTISEGMVEGEGRQAIMYRIRGKFDWMSKTRAKTITQTELHGCVEKGQYELFKATEVPKKRWLAFPGQLNPREWHVNVMSTYTDGIPMDQPFILNGPGGSVGMMHPHDDAGGAENNISCHCDLIPMTSKGKAAKVTYKDFMAWVQGLEEGKDYLNALAAFFQREKERYVEYFINVSGGVA